MQDTLYLENIEERETGVKHRKERERKEKEGEAY